MSKAFTRESDDAPEKPMVSRPAAILPPGAKNYLTASGARRLREELERLAGKESAGSAEGGVLREQRKLQIVECLRTAEVVEPPAQPWDQVRFGATVTVRNKAGNETRFRIVGVDETDIDRDWVSWLSPIARALLKARLGERVRFRFPDGEDELEIMAISYE
jgi:transcription elongation factor GreB